MTLEADGSYSETIALVEGPNTIIEVAVDLAGNTKTESKTVRLDTTPPVISNDPVATPTNDPDLTVIGTMTDLGGSGVASFTINGQPMTLGAG